MKKLLNFQSTVNSFSSVNSSGSDSGPVTEGTSQPYKSLLGTPWSNEGAGYVGLLITGHLVSGIWGQVSLSRLVVEVCVCGQNSLLISVRKIHAEARKSQNLEFEPIGSNSACIFPLFIYTYMCVCVYVSIITAHHLEDYIHVSCKICLVIPSHYRREILAVRLIAALPGS